MNSNLGGVSDDLFIPVHIRGSEVDQNVHQKHHVNQQVDQRYWVLLLQKNEQISAKSFDLSINQFSFQGHLPDSLLPWVPFELEPFLRSEPSFYSLNHLMVKLSMFSVVVVVVGRKGF